MPDESRIFHFHSAAVADDTFQIDALRGFEELSTPYEFELNLQSKNADVWFPGEIRIACQLGSSGHKDSQAGF